MLIAIHTCTHKHPHTHAHMHTYTHTHLTGLRTQLNTFLSGGMEKNSVSVFAKFSTVEDLIDHSESKPVIGEESSSVYLVMPMYSKLTQICPC